MQLSIFSGSVLRKERQVEQTRVWWRGASNRQQVPKRAICKFSHDVNGVLAKVRNSGDAGLPAEVALGMNDVAVKPKVVWHPSSIKIEN